MTPAELGILLDAEHRLTAPAPAGASGAPVEQGTMGDLTDLAALARKAR